MSKSSEMRTHSGRGLISLRARAFKKNFLYKSAYSKSQKGRGDRVVRWSAAAGPLNGDARRYRLYLGSNPNPGT